VWSKLIHGRNLFVPKRWPSGKPAKNSPNSAETPYSLPQPKTLANPTDAFFAHDMLPHNGVRPPKETMTITNSGIFSETWEKGTNMFSAPNFSSGLRPKPDHMILTSRNQTYHDWNLLIKWISNIVKQETSFPQEKATVQRWAPTLTLDFGVLVNDKPFHFRPGSWSGQSEFHRSLQLSIWVRPFYSAGACSTGLSTLRDLYLLGRRIRNEIKVLTQHSILDQVSATTVSATWRLKSALV